VAGGRLYIQWYGMLLWLEGDCKRSGMVWYGIVAGGRLYIKRYGIYCSWREIVYKTAWNIIVVGGPLYIQRYGRYCGWMEIVYTAVWSGIVFGGRFYIQQYGIVLWLEGDFIYSGLECYCG